ncbi:MAG TPA: hypothetical protein VG367_18015 [Mucilaginibacter sp.]|nr:hypothetical protein [Mucilaginibacter sp.]
MKKILTLFLFAAALTACKKNNTTPQYELTGTWALSSTATNGKASTAANYPCLANEKLVFGAGNNATVSWINTGTCWINQQHTASFSGTDGEVLTFTRKGNDLYFPPAAPSASIGHAIVISTNGKLQMTLRDTLRMTGTNVPDTLYQSEVYIKQ